jgi:ATP-binding cassette subfamily C protein
VCGLLGRSDDTEGSRSAALDGTIEPMELPAPVASLKIEKITVAAPGTGRVLLTEVSLELKAGQALGVIGPSGGGKTTLVKAITGVWPALRGSVRLDDAELTQWRDDALGQFIGYLPQEVGMMDATIEENISRFDTGANPRDVVAAAKAAGIHEMIVRLPDGYQSKLGPQGSSLSAGQRQASACARSTGILHRRHGRTHPTSMAKARRR